MEPEAYPVRSRLIPSATVAILAVVVGFMFVKAFTVSWRAVALFPLAALFLLACAVFVNRFRDFLLFCLVYLIPFQFGYHIVLEKLGPFEHTYRTGIVIDSVDVMLIGLYLLWALGASVGRSSSKPITIGGKLGAIFLVWVGYLLVSSLLISERLHYSLFAVVDFFKGFMLYFYLVNNIEDDRDLTVILYGLFANTVTHALYIAFQFATGLNYTAHGEASKHYVPLEGFRPVGLTGSWDEAGILIATGMSVMLAYTLIVTKGPKRQFFLVVLVTVMTGLLLTKMRSAWIAGMVAVVLVFLIAYFKRRIPSGLLVKGGVALLILVLATSPFVVHRLVTGTRGEVRAPLMYTAWNMFKDNWVAGVGLGNYYLHTAQYVPQELRGTWVFTVHNEYLLYLSETGIIGFFLYYLMLLLAMKKLWAGVGARNPVVFSTSLGLFAAIIGSLPNRIFSLYMFPSIVITYCVIFAIASRVEAMARANQQTTIGY